MVEHKDFITLLGGPTVVAKKLSELSGEELDREAVYKWNTKGIPWRWRPHLLTWARDAGIAVPDNFLPGVPA